MEFSPLVMQTWARHVAKDAAFAAEYEDAYSINLEQARVAIADGVSSAIFSGRWARILTSQITENPPDMTLPDGWVTWLAEPRRRWLEDIDFPRMPVHQKNKLRQVGGAYCTLCWIEADIAKVSQPGGFCQLRAFAMGDSCVLHLRDGELSSSFPLATSAEFDLDPDSVCSVATSRDRQQQIKSTVMECHEGDVLVMVTDALGKWIFDCVERGEIRPWERLWALDDAEWMAEIEHLRETNLMKRDDTTMVALQIGEGIPAWELTRAAIAQTRCNTDDATSADEACDVAGDESEGQFVHEGVESHADLIDLDLEADPGLSDDIDRDMERDSREVGQGATDEKISMVFDDDLGPMGA